MSDGDTYEIIDDMPQAPRLPGQVVLSEDADRAIDAIGLDIMSQAKACERVLGTSPPRTRRLRRGHVRAKP